MPSNKKSAAQGATKPSSAKKPESLAKDVGKASPKAPPKAQRGAPVRKASKAPAATKSQQSEQTSRGHASRAATSPRAGQADAAPSFKARSKAAPDKAEHKLVALQGGRAEGNDVEHAGAQLGTSKVPKAPKSKGRAAGSGESAQARNAGPVNPDSMTPELIEFLTAVDEYKRKQMRPFPSFSEIFEIVKRLGYKKSA